MAPGLESLCHTPSGGPGGVGRVLARSSALHVQVRRSPGTGHVQARCQAGPGKVPAMYWLGAPRWLAGEAIRRPLCKNSHSSCSLASRQGVSAWSPGKVGAGRALGCRGSSGVLGFPDGAPPNGTVLRGPSGPRSVGPCQATLDFWFPPMGRPRDPVSAPGGPWLPWHPATTEP